MSRATYIVTMPEGGEAGVICIRKAHEASWIEFRGTPYSQWTDATCDPFSTIHDWFPGPQCSVLHAEVELHIHPGHICHDGIEQICITA